MPSRAKSWPSARAASVNDPSEPVLEPQKTQMRRITAAHHMEIRTRPHAVITRGGSDGDGDADALARGDARAVRTGTEGSELGRRRARRREVSHRVVRRGRLPRA